MNTKERILEKSLTIFSTHGYSDVTVRDITASVGIKASSLYNHFDRKQDIFDTIVNKYSTINEYFFDKLNDFEHNCISDNKLAELCLN